MHKLGVRSMLLLNKFDNPLTGVRFDSGPTGVLINAGNKHERRLVLERADLQRPRCTDNTIFTPGRRTIGAALNGLLAHGRASRRGTPPPIRPRRTATRAASPSSASTSCERHDGPAARSSTPTT